MYKFLGVILLSVISHLQVGGKLAKEMKGALYDIFARILRGLSGARITRPGAFKNALSDGVAVRCSYKADDGLLYPLDKAFFYVHKPPLLIPYEDVEVGEPATGRARQDGKDCWTCADYA